MRASTVFTWSNIWVIRWSVVHLATRIANSTSFRQQNVSNEHAETGTGFHFNQLTVLHNQLAWSLAVRLTSCNQWYVNACWRVPRLLMSSTRMTAWSWSASGTVTGLSAKMILVLVPGIIVQCSALRRTLFLNLNIWMVYNTKFVANSISCETVVFRWIVRQ